MKDPLLAFNEVTFGYHQSGNRKEESWREGIIEIDPEQGRSEPAVVRSKGSRAVVPKTGFTVSKSPGPGALEQTVAGQKRSGPVVTSVQCVHSRESDVLRGLSFSIFSGSATAVLGPNGVGKTTLLFLALGWLKAQGGEVVLAGRPVHTYGQSERGRLMSLVPQREHIPFEYSLLEYVLLGRAPHLRPLEMPGEEDHRIALDSLKRVGLGEKPTRSINRLSSGERQLLLLARSLVQRPRLLLLDEPTSHLDVGNKKRIVDLLKGMQSEGITLLFTTHDPQVAASLADQLLLMRRGVVAKAGAPEEVLTTDLLTETYGVEVRVVKVDGEIVILWT